MIQRIQSIYLLLTSVLSIIFLKGNYLTFFDNSGSVLNLSMTGLWRLAEAGTYEKLGGVWMIFIPGLIIPAVSLVTIFLFRRRDLQLLLAKIHILIILMFISASLIYTLVIISKYSASLDNWYKLLVPVFQFIFVIQALRGIKRDDNLVKSYDRLR